MCDSAVIERLYGNVLREDVARLELSTDAIRNGIRNMIEVHKPDPNSLSSATLDVADYNDPAHRCAYLHKYAPLHTALVVNMLDKVVVKNVTFFKDLLAKHGSLKICSLGGGPGCDIIAAIAVLHEAFGYFTVNATIVDIMIGWRQTFYSIIQELKYGDYGLLGEHVSEQYLKWSYIEANLIGKMKDEVNRTIGSANLITMVKFVSASSCQESSDMIRKIFRSMRHGAVVLYIDNAGGGFHQMVRRQAQLCNLITIYGPLKHEHYESRAFDVKRFGYTPCLETRVTIHAWRKPFQGGNANRNDNPDHANFANRNGNVVPIRVPNSRPPQRSRSRSRSRSNQREPVRHQPTAGARNHTDNTDTNNMENNDCPCCVIS